MANFLGYNFIFRYPWLVKVNFKIYFKTRTFKWWNNKKLKKHISLTSLKDILNNTALGEKVYILYLKEYWIQPLFYNKINTKLSIGNEPFIMAIP